jgi:hypothetical protein
VVANGQFMLVRRETYEAVHGHKAICSEVMDDISLATLIKQSGYKMYWLSGELLIRVRMYKNLREIWEGFSKHAVDILGKGKFSLTLYEVFNVLLFGVGPVFLPLMNWFVYVESSQSIVNFLFLILSLFESLFLFSIYFYVAIFLNIPFGYGLLFPFGLTIQAIIILHSIYMKVTKKTVWKGREYIEKTTN